MITQLPTVSRVPFYVPFFFSGNYRHHRLQVANQNQSRGGGGGGGGLGADDFDDDFIKAPLSISRHVVL